MSANAPRDGLTPVEVETLNQVYRDDDRGTYHLWYDAETYEGASTAVAVAVAAARGVDPTTLEPLSDVVDPDALNTMCRHWCTLGSAGEHCHLSFPFGGCLVTVSADGEIVVDPTEL